MLLAHAGKASFWNTSIADFVPLGPGVPLYFTLLRHLGCFFVLACVLTVPIILFSYAGGSLDTVEMATEIDALHAVFLSIANIGLPKSIADEADLVPLSSRPSLKFSRRGASLIIMAVDLAMVLAYLIFSVVLRCNMAIATRAVRTQVAKASDYAIYVTGLPKNATEDEVRRRRVG